MSWFPRVQTDMCTKVEIICGTIGVDSCVLLVSENSFRSKIASANRKEWSHGIVVVGSEYEIHVVLQDHTEKAARRSCVQVNSGCSK